MMVQEVSPFLWLIVVATVCSFEIGRASSRQEDLNLAHLRISAAPLLFVGSFMLIAIGSAMRSPLAGPYLCAGGDALMLVAIFAHRRSRAKH